MIRLRVEPETLISSVTLDLTHSGSVLSHWLLISDGKLTTCGFVISANCSQYVKNCSVLQSGFAFIISGLVFFLFSLSDSRGLLRSFSFWLMLFPLGIPTIYLPLSFCPWRTPCKKTTVKATNVVEGLNWTLQSWFYLIFCGFRDRFWYSFITVLSGWHNSDEPLTFPALLKIKPTVCCKQRSSSSDYILADFFFLSSANLPLLEIQPREITSFIFSFFYYSRKIKKFQHKMYSLQRRVRVQQLRIYVHISYFQSGFLMLIPSGQTDNSYRPLNEFYLWKLKTDTFSFPAVRLLRSVWEHHDVQAGGEMQQWKVFYALVLKQNKY